MTKVPLTRIIALAAITSAITAVGFLLTAPIPLIPGAIHWRVLAFLPCVFGILFGPRIGFVSGAIGNTLWALLGGYFNLATPIFDLVGVGLTGLIPGALVHPSELRRRMGLLKATIVSTIAGFIMVPIVAFGFQWAGVAPFGVAVYLLILSDIPPILVGTPIALAALHPLFQSRGLLEGRW